MIYLGPALDHAEDVHRFYNPQTGKTCMSRDVIWLGKVYGQWKGLHRPNKLEDVVAAPVDADKDDLIEEPPANPPEDNPNQDPEEPEPEQVEAATPPAPPPKRVSFQTGVTTRSSSGLHTNKKVVSAMKKLSGTHNPEATSIVERNRRLQAAATTAVPSDNSPTGREDPESANVLQSLTLIDKFQGDFADVALMMEAGRVSPDLTEEEMAQLKPEQYRDVFEKPTKFDEAWNHPSPFQRKLWREGIVKELKKMEEHRVWVKVKRSSIPRDRRLVKCKWVFEIKRNGIFRCRLVACGYSQVGGVDFDQIYNSVVNDVTFRIMLTAKLVWGLQSGLFDVETAFLNADMDKELYMAIPEGLDAEADD